MITDTPADDPVVVDTDTKASARTRRRRRGFELTRRGLIVFELIYLVALVALAVAYAHAGWMQRLVPDPAGPIPLGVIWWGALGGVAISLYGTVPREGDVEEKWENWNLTRPALGGLMGAVGYLVFVTVIQAAGSEDVQAGDSSAVFYLVAFLVGYREHVFRKLLERAVDVLLTPGDDQSVKQRRSNGQMQ